MLRLAVVLAALATGASGATLQLSFTGAGEISEIITLDAPSVADLDYSLTIEALDLLGTSAFYQEAGGGASSWQSQFRNLSFISFQFTTDAAGEITSLSGGALASDFTDAIWRIDEVEFLSTNPLFGDPFVTPGTWSITELAEVPLPASGILLLAGLGALRLRHNRCRP